MKVFLSWSGTQAQQIADAFRQWLPSVIQAAKPYFTPDDITKGTRWNDEISKELDSSKIGIIFLTKDSLNSKWIMFEAGALSKNVDKSKVIPILFGLEPTDVEGPLVQFQGAKFSKTEILKVVKTINSDLGEFALLPDVLESVFNKWWPELEEKINKVDLKDKQIEKSTRTERDLLEEILDLSRKMFMTKLRDSSGQINPAVIEDIIKAFADLVITTFSYSYIDLRYALQKFIPPIEYLLNEYNLTGGIHYADIKEEFSKGKVHVDALFEMYNQSQKQI